MNIIKCTSHDCAVSHCKECILGWGCNEVYFCLDEQLVITASPGDQQTNTPKLSIHCKYKIHVFNYECNNRALYLNAIF